MLISYDDGRVFSETWVLVMRRNKHAPISFVSSYYGTRNWVTQRGGTWGIIDRSVLGCCGGAGGGGRGGGGNASTEREPHAPEITTHLAVLQGAALGWGSLICVHNRWIVTCRSCEMWGYVTAVIMSITLFWDISTFQKDLLISVIGLD